jgi:hypothetical protein
MKRALLPSLLTAVLAMIGIAPTFGDESPATRPVASQPAETSDAAARDLADAKAASLAKLKITQKYQDAKRARDDAEIQLEAARAGDDVQAKLDASSAYTKAAAALKNLEATTVATDPAVIVAQAQLTDAKAREARAAQDAVAAKKAAEEHDPILNAIKHHQIVKGMTMDQMKAAMQYSTDIKHLPLWRAEPTITDADGETTYDWNIGYDTLQNGAPLTVTRIVSATLKDGKVIDVIQTRHDSQFYKEPDFPDGGQ